MIIATAKLTSTEKERLARVMNELDWSDLVVVDHGDGTFDSVTSMRADNDIVASILITSITSGALARARLGKLFSIRGEDGADINMVLRSACATLDDAEHLRFMNDVGHLDWVHLVRFSRCGNTTTIIPKNADGAGHLFRSLQDGLLSVWGYTKKFKVTAN